MKDKYAAKLEKLRKRHELKREFYRLLKEHASDILSSSNFKSTRNYIQHGSIPVYNHCMDVAGKSIALSRFLGAGCNERDLIRGALLHDKEYTLSKRERDIIKKHMWPLTVVPPRCREAWIVTAADKYCSLIETLRLRRMAHRPVKRAGAKA